MNPLSTPRLVRLWCGIISHTALSIIWLCINNKQLLHYFPHYSALNLLMWSYVHFTSFYLFYRVSPLLYRVSA